MGPEGTLCKFIKSNSDGSQQDAEDSLRDQSFNDTSYSCDTEDEADTNPVRAVLITSSHQGLPGAPLRLEVDTSGQVRAPSCVPICVVTNPRSAWNKLHNVRIFHQQICLDVMILSEYWGRKRSFANALALNNYKVKESSRGVRRIPTKGKN